MSGIFAKFCFRIKIEIEVQYISHMSLFQCHVAYGVEEATVPIFTKVRRQTRKIRIYKSTISAYTCSSFSFIQMLPSQRSSKSRNPVF